MKIALRKLEPSGAELQINMQAGKVRSVTGNEDKRPYVCPKCNLVFDKFEVFDSHLKGFCKVNPEKKAFCIAFKGSDCSSPQKKINFTVDDYYYGQAAGSSKYKKRIVSKKFSCYSCGKVLRNNLRFMSHVRHKIENEWKENDSVNDFNICNHCYRHYTSPFHLQCHIETVHATVPAATTCRICELNFENEQVFLLHMKDRHTYNEMPYICKLCSYRSSFYHELIQHFRLAHENCSSLLCPFCLAIHQTANSYLTHVIQHMNKAVRCTQCRLQFFTSKDKAMHLEKDHCSVLNGTEKRNLPKNPNQYMIFVKVSHHPLSPTKPNEYVKKDHPTNKIESLTLLTKDGWSLTSQHDPQIPLDYRPYVREEKVFVVLSFEALQHSVTNCIECGENLGVFVSNYNKHFQREYRCRKCSFCTRCFKGMKKHILVYHMKQRYNPVTDKNTPGTVSLPSFHAVKDVQKTNKKTDSPTSSSTSRREEGPTSSASPSTSHSREDRDYAPSASAASSVGESSCILRKSNKHNTDATPSDAPVNHQPSVSRNHNISPSNNEKDGVEALKSSYSCDEAPSNAAQKQRAARKRKLTDINSLLLLKQQEQENERSSKQRRKQSKPQKVELDDAVKSDRQNVLLRAENLRPAASDERSRQAFFLLKPLSKIVAEEEREKSRKSMKPPPLDNSFAIGCDDDDVEALRGKTSEPESGDKMRKRKSSPGKLTVKFASHLGLSKKGTAETPPAKSSPSLKSFSNFGLHSPYTPAPWTGAQPAAAAKMRKQKGSHSTARKSINAERTPAYPSIPTSAKSTLAAKNMAALAQKTSNATNLSDLLQPPTCLRFTEVTSSSFLVSWICPAKSNVTEFKLVFQGAGLPTSQRLPAEQTSVRLIGLRSNTLYLVQLCSVYRFLQSSNVEGIQRTLGLREFKTLRNVKVDDVIVLDDDDSVTDTSSTSNKQSSTSTVESSAEARPASLGDDGKQQMPVITTHSDRTQHYLTASEKPTNENSLPSAGDDNTGSATLSSVSPPGTTDAPVSCSKAVPAPESSPEAVSDLPPSSGGQKAATSVISALNSHADPASRVLTKPTGSESVSNKEPTSSSVQSLPHSVQSLPHSVQSLPHSVQSLPHSVQSLPHSVQSMSIDSDTKTVDARDGKDTLTTSSSAVHDLAEGEDSATPKAGVGKKGTGFQEEEKRSDDSRDPNEQVDEVAFDQTPKRRDSYDSDVQLLEDSSGSAKEPDSPSADVAVECLDSDDDSKESMIDADSGRSIEVTVDVHCPGKGSNAIPGIEPDTSERSTEQTDDRTNQPKTCSEVKSKKAGIETETPSFNGGDPSSLEAGFDQLLEEARAGKLLNQFKAREKPEPDVRLDLVGDDDEKPLLSGFSPITNHSASAHTPKQTLTLPNAISGKAASNKLSKPSLIVPEKAKTVVKPPHVDLTHNDSFEKASDVSEVTDHTMSIQDLDDMLSILDEDE